jgi:hypothetical protein
MTMRIRYANQLGVSLFDLEDQVENMIELCSLAQAILGDATQLSGFDCTPSTIPDLNVHVAGGTIFKMADVLETAIGELPTQIPADTTQILKYATQLASTPFAIVPPTTPGFSRNDIIQFNFQEVDGDLVNVPFWNGVTGNVPNPPIFADKNVKRLTNVIISVKAGTPAATGTQTTPTPDTGYVAAWIITTAQGQTQITGADINEYPNAPFISNLSNAITQAFADARYAQKTQVQINSFNLSNDTGAANAYVATLTPAITSYVYGLEIYLKIAHDNTGASTVAVNGLSTKSIKLTNGNDPGVGDLKTGMIAQLFYDGTNVQLLNPATTLSSYSPGTLVGGQVVTTATTAVISGAKCRSYADDQNIILGSTLTKTLSAWAAGNSNGGVPSGVTLSSGLTLHLFLISKADGTTDAGFDTSQSATNLLAAATGYLYYRRIASYVLNGSSQLPVIIQNGDTFLYSTPILDVNVTIADSTAHLATMSIPSGLNCNGLFNVHEANTGDAAVYISSPDTVDVAPSASATPLSTQYLAAAGASNINVANQIECYTDTSSRIRYRAINNGQGLLIATLGYVDTRGRT